MNQMLKHATILMLFALTLTSATAHAGEDWRPHKGKKPVRIGTAGSLFIGAQQPPALAPGAAGAQASVSEQKFNTYKNLGTQSGFPCQEIGSINLCDLGGK
jgi:hypothetical protein